MTEEQENKLGKEITEEWNQLMLKINMVCTELSEEGTMKLALLMNSISEQANISGMACAIMVKGGIKGEGLRKGMRSRAKEEKKKHIILN